jgi:hypothetical protein
MNMSYIRFGLMILTSTVVMFVLMYLNTYALEHVFFSETRVYMAIVMGAAMAVVMLAYMLGMYKNMPLNIAIFVGAVALFALALWLVRSQTTVSGTSYMRAMIPHHSIAIMTSERAQIRDPHVRKLADEIIEAQRREIAEMRYLIAEVANGNDVESIYKDPPPETGTVEDALASTQIARLDPAPMSEAEADTILQPSRRCSFSWSQGSDPILWLEAGGGTAAMKLNGVLVALDGAAPLAEDGTTFTASGATVSVRRLGDESDWRNDAELIFMLEQGLRIGYRGFYRCAGS